MSEAAETGVGLCEADDPTDSQPDGAERRGAERRGEEGSANASRAGTFRPRC